MNIGITADMHFNPGDRLLCNMKAYDLWVDIGDMLNIIPFGMKPWRTPDGDTTVKSIATSCNKGVFIWKNHGGRKEWMQELFKGYPHIRIVDGYELLSDDRLYIFMHGSEFTDWRIWQTGADDITAWMTRFPLLRNLWYKFCIWKGWLPSHYKGGDDIRIGGKPSSPSKKYEKLIGAIHELAIKKADDEDMPTTLYYGHTHRYIRTETDQGNVVVNMRNRQKVEIMI